jgi:hypothetical protein
MYVCMYVCMYACLYVSMYYVCLHVCMYVCINVCIYACMYVVSKSHGMSLLLHVDCDGASWSGNADQPADVNDQLV